MLDVAEPSIKPPDIVREYPGREKLRLKGNHPLVIGGGWQSCLVYSWYCRLQCLTHLRLF